ncbi:MAG TPA: family 10 glycosylhydrolase [archaeon]|nr:family 10 glycosylhydrolase [archaeon]
MQNDGRCFNFALTFILLVFFFCSSGAAAFLTAGPAKEGRALWVVRTSLLSAKSIDQLVEKASQGGFNTLFVQVSGRGDAYFPSRVYPAAEDCRYLLESGFDPLAYALERAHAKGIAVHAWVNAFLIWSSPKRPASSAHVLNRHPDWMMVDKDGVSLARYGYSRFSELNITGIFLSPAGDRATRMLEEFVLDLVSRYPLDGIHLDYLRYPTGTVDFSPEARKEFETITGVDPVNLFNGQSRKDRSETEYRELLKQWKAFRAELVTRFLAKLAKSLNQLKPQLVRSVAVKPDIDSAYEDFGQDWARWVKDGLLDMVLPMAYSTRPEVVRSQISRACREVGPAHVWAGLRAWDVPVSGIIQRAQQIQGLNLAGYCFFSYDGMKDNPLFFESVKKVLFTP